MHCKKKKKAQKWKHIYIFLKNPSHWAFFVWERRGSYNTRVIKRSKREQRSILERGWQKKSLKHLKSRGSKSKSNLKNFLESVYSNLKNPTNSCWIQVSFYRLSRGYRGKHRLANMFLDSGDPGKTCNSKIKLGPWKTEQHFSYTKTIWYAHWTDPLELEYKLLKSWPPVTF